MTAYTHRRELIETKPKAGPAALQVGVEGGEAPAGRTEVGHPGRGREEDLPDVLGEADRMVQCAPTA